MNKQEEDIKNIIIFTCSLMVNIIIRSTFSLSLIVNCPSLKTEACNSRPYGQW